MSNLIIPQGQALIEHVDAEGNPVKTPVVHAEFSHEEAKLLRDFKKLILQKYGLAYQMHCRECMHQGRPHETEGGIMPDRIAIACSHRMLTYLGQTF